jgi:NAD(P)-dependent dehydrogenase (short-subunit alcohol dehydrogenase family)
MGIDLKGKVCVVTGAARSIGLAVAEKYCEHGASVALIDILPEVMDQADRLKKEGYNVAGYILNITDQDAVMACFDVIAKDLGDVFALANIAGAVDQQSIEEMSPARIDKMMQINFNGTVYCVQGALKTMKNYKDGRIINFASKSGKTGSALMGAYSGAKGAIISLTHALAFELAGDQIKVNCLCPGIVDATGVWTSVSKGYIENMKMERDEIVDKFTAKIPLQRLAAIDDIVAWCEFLTIHGDYNTGQAFNVSGGREVH